MWEGAGRSDGGMGKGKDEEPECNQWPPFSHRAQRLQDQLKLLTFTFQLRVSVISRACGRKGMFFHHLLGQEHQIRYVVNLT